MDLSPDKKMSEQMHNDYYGISSEAGRAPPPDPFISFNEADAPSFNEMITNTLDVYLHKRFLFFGKNLIKLRNQIIERADQFVTSYRDRQSSGDTYRLVRKRLIYDCYQDYAIIRSNLTEQNLDDKIKREMDILEKRVIYLKERGVLTGLTGECRKLYEGGVDLFQTAYQEIMQEIPRDWEVKNIARVIAQNENLIAGLQVVINTSKRIKQHCDAEKDSIRGETIAKQLTEQVLHDKDKKEVIKKLFRELSVEEREMLLNELLGL